MPRQIHQDLDSKMDQRKLRKEFSAMEKRLHADGLRELDWKCKLKTMGS